MSYRKSEVTGSGHLMVARLGSPLIELLVVKHDYPESFRFEYISLFLNSEGQVKSYRHRIDGPAAVYIRDTELWYYCGVNLTLGRHTEIVSENKIRTGIK